MADKTRMIQVEIPIGKFEIGDCQSGKRQVLLALKIVEITVVEETRAETVCHCCLKSK